LQCNHKLLFLKGGNSNLIDCNAITLNFQKKGGNSNLIDCNAITHNKKTETTPTDWNEITQKCLKREVTPI
jgi:hypothetical protein